MAAIHVPDRANFGAKPFSTGLSHNMVLKVEKESVLDDSAALGSGTGTSATFSTSS